MNFQLRGRVIFFATNNVNKFNEACNVLAHYRIAAGMIRAKTSEIQSDSLEEIAKESVMKSFQECNLPVIVEDAGLFIEALNGFPGPYAAYVYRTIGNRGLLQFMENTKDRKAKFQSAVAYYDAELKSPMCFKDEVIGEITRKERKGDGKSGFGFDPVFRPINSCKTFAEMSTSEKNRYSHRAKAFRTFAKWYGRFR
ncbi:MAG: XTP/dITP diphosphatase [Candidatus Bathyarchaeota archaeon]|nr:XTP/dITP diphosphatase [Candidatus Bathyarchaeota archaeon]MDH5788107.1 XTP/dITP diphosphatase [Candidatus Bathyarchaeota archaeon]